MSKGDNMSVLNKNKLIKKIFLKIIFLKKNTIITAILLYNWHLSVFSDISLTTLHFFRHHPSFPANLWLLKMEKTASLHLDKETDHSFSISLDKEAMGFFAQLDGETGHVFSIHATKKPTETASPYVF